MKYHQCVSCGQPMPPKGRKKKAGEFDHAFGCPLAPGCTSRITVAEVEKLLEWHCGLYATRDPLTKTTIKLARTFLRQAYNASQGQS